MDASIREFCSVICYKEEMKKENTGKSMIRILIDGKTVRAEKGETLLEILTGSGTFLRSDCGGKGLCGKCLVRIPGASIEKISSPEDAEVRIIGQKDIDAGYRLACRAKILNDLPVEIPGNSILSPEVIQKGQVMLPGSFSFIGLPAGTNDRYGIAVDLGTTTIAVYLCNLVSGKVAGSVSVKNPQAMLGDDVISRISAVAENPGALPRLQKMAVKAIEWCAASICRSFNIDPGHIRSAVVVGNSTMIHLFTGDNPSSIGVFPYTPLFVEDKKFRAESVGFEFNPSADILTLPLISGFLGSDILAAALATDLANASPGTMLIDIGTNGEVMLMGKNGLFAASCATGPAFEGAAVRHGMHAVSGAIDSVEIDMKSGGVACSVIQKDQNGNRLPSGICGSGVISAVAELYRAGLVSKDGRFNRNPGSSLIRYDKNGLPEFELVSADKSESRQAITLTQKDIRAVQLAKAALFSGIMMVCRSAGLKKPERILVSGAFGTFIDVNDAKTIGMLPDLSPENIAGIGNGAGAGAVLALFNPEFIDKANALARAVTVLELATLPEFQQVFLSSLSFPELDRP
jgi:uncharacterized 2Fe-2S/4Fe-4S cluster protein (DUF4445 family)